MPSEHRYMRPSARDLQQYRINKVGRAEPRAMRCKRCKLTSHRLTVFPLCTKCVSSGSAAGRRRRRRGSTTSFTGRDGHVGPHWGNCGDRPSCRTADRILDFPRFDNQSVAAVAIFPPYTFPMCRVLPTMQTVMNPNLVRMNA